MPAPHRRFSAPTTPGATAVWRLTRNASRCERSLAVGNGRWPLATVVCQRLSRRRRRPHRRHRSAGRHRLTDLLVSRALRRSDGRGATAPRFAFRNSEAEPRSPGGAAKSPLPIPPPPATSPRPRRPRPPRRPTRPTRLLPIRIAPPDSIGHPCSSASTRSTFSSAVPARGSQDRRSPRDRARLARARPPPDPSLPFEGDPCIDAAPSD